MQIISLCTPAPGQLTAPAYADVAHVSGAGGERERGGRGGRGLEGGGFGEKWRRTG